MNIPRLLSAIAAAFVLIFVTDMLVHGLWLKPDYQATSSIWRPEAEMTSMMYWMFLAQLICAVTFVVIWAKGAPGRSIGTGIMFGLLMGLFQQIWAIVNYVVLPMPGELAAKWFFAGTIQAMLLGLVVALIYRPRVIGA